MKRFLFGLLALCGFYCADAQITLRSGQPLRIAIDPQERPVTHTALRIFGDDYRAVFDAPVIVDAAVIVDAGRADIVIASLGSPLLPAEFADTPALKGKKEAFLLTVTDEGQLVVAGSDAHGAAYGILELSRLIGVSPWTWWADVKPEKREAFALPVGYTLAQSPSVEYRGIFINDEDWGLMPWSSHTYEPSDKPGHIGPRTTARIFELLLRLRANTYWPPMHECSMPFFLTKGNREVAAQYGIYIGSSHCEPMACNVANEWAIRGKGEYDYAHNDKQVRRFWEKRVEEVAGQEIIYTLGMRGVHDGAMRGVRGIEEQKNVLQQVIYDQREMLRRHVNADLRQVPQVFIPYKEVLDVYHAGLQVPDSVTLMWCDDNYGYIRHFPDATERARAGGNGIYYHISYWGRPHDYLWLCTVSPQLIFQQMSEAYNRGIRRMWILNVGDIKPGEYQMSLFLDMAWDMESVVKQGVRCHIDNWLHSQLRLNTLGSIMEEHYRLAFEYKPEYMGNTRTEERNPAWNVVKDLPWSEATIDKRISRYRALSDTVQKEWEKVKDDTNRNAAFFQLVKYPVQAAAQMNFKLLYAQLARHGKAAWTESDAAFDSIAVLTRQYNGLENGKWRGIMDFQPRRLPVFDRIPHTTATPPMTVDRTPLATLTPTVGEVSQGALLTFDLDTLSTVGDSIKVEIRLLPTHPIDGNKLRFAITLDDGTPIVTDYHTEGRSEEWKRNVLRNQAVRRINLPLKKQIRHRLAFIAIDPGVTLQEIVIYPTQ
jgi:hypothetical protein